MAAEKTDMLTLCGHGGLVVVCGAAVGAAGELAGCLPNNSIKRPLHVWGVVSTNAGCALIGCNKLISSIIVT